MKFDKSNNGCEYCAVQKDSFNKYVTNTPVELPYDIASITHYPFNVFAVDPNLPTIVPKRPNSRIGQTDGLSETDVAKIRRAYKCDGKIFSHTYIHIIHHLT